MGVNAKYMKILRVNRGIRGECQRCGKPLCDGFKNCPTCRDYVDAYKKKREANL